MKLTFYCVIVLLTNTFVNHQDDEIFNYKKGLSLVLHSNDYKKYGLSDKNYQVSSEIIAFSNFDRFFKDELNKNIPVEIVENEVVKLRKELLNLNLRKCGKVKVFFSEQRENIFFVEIFIDKKKNIEYKQRPIFGSSKVYMFKIRNEEISLVAVKDMYYN
jgi:hypothetical protein